MKREQFYKHLRPYLNKFYSFAYALIPDELQATQLVVDATKVFFVKEKNFIKDWQANWGDEDSLKDNHRRIAKSFNKEIIIGLLENIYELANKRQKQLYQFENPFEDKATFYQVLNFESRAVIFLKHRWSMSFHDIKLVTNFDKHEVICKLYSSRRLLETKYEMDFPKALEVINQSIDLSKSSSHVERGENHVR